MKVVYVASLLMWNITLVGTNTRLAAQDLEATRLFHECFLYHAADGDVWIGEPLVSLGMVGVRADPPRYRLSAQLAERLAPFVNELQDTPATPRYWWWGLPTPKQPDQALVVLRMEAEVTLRNHEQPAATAPQGEVYEVTSVNLVYAEIIAGEWLRAFRRLDDGLNKIVQHSRTAPSQEKTKLLAEVIEQSSRALNTMVSADVSDRIRPVLKRIEPRARVVRLLQSNVEERGMGEWGRQLRQYVDILQIEPQTPLPRLSAPCPTVELLARSTTAEESLRTIQGDWSEAVLDERLIYSTSLNRTVFVWQVDQLTPAQFTALRREADDELARREQEAKDSARAVDANEPFQVVEWNVVLGPATPELLAEKGLLHATVVHEARSGESNPGLQTGDVIVDYERLDDLTMMTIGFDRNRVQRIARYGGKLEVLRDNRILMLTAKPRGDTPP